VQNYLLNYLLKVKNEITEVEELVLNSIILDLSNILTIN